MRFFADYHTHTTYSDGRGTPAENIQAASLKGLEVLAITDHGPKNIGTGVASPDTFLAIKEEVAELAGRFPAVKVLVGAEAAVTGRDGRLELPEHIIDQLDLLIAGLHPYYLPDSLGDALHFTLPNLVVRLNRSVWAKMRNTNTKALVGAVHRYPVSFTSHPGLMMPVDLDELALACAVRETSLEVNTGHNYNKEEIVHAAARWGAKLVVNSDAHFPATVGNLDEGAALLERLNFPAEMVINAVH
ncbi:PHP domain-containing protein [Pelotomaculum sp. FP]|uniref:PHP domain-containing protein n=1 Tax=Pelotomaculum sp. FP TaxID=261474 RepID=UPI00106634C7|nr:PHP domain-containing protein [Pelotomaculum sp. FP]